MAIAIYYILYGYIASQKMLLCCACCSRNHKVNIWHSFPAPQIFCCYPKLGTICSPPLFLSSALYFCLPSCGIVVSLRLAISYHLNINIIVSRAHMCVQGRRSSKKRKQLPQLRFRPKAKLKATWHESGPFGR